MEEIENEIESTESDATEGSSSEASESDSENGEAAAKAAAAPKQEPEIDWSKAFEHPRFKELIGQKNEAQSKYQEIESRYKTLEQQLTQIKESQPKPPTEFDSLLKDLKQVDPRLAAALESQAKAAQQAEALQARLDAFERQSQQTAQQSQIQSAVTKINQMHESNKVSPEVKQLINDKLDLLYMQGKLNFQNLDQTYKEQYAAYKKMEDTMTRQIRESYVKAKKQDSSVPTSQPKGNPARPAPKALTVPKDKDALRAAVVKSFLKEQAATKAADNS
jgi:DNA repair exonuclease SbcCD ATPase subunit